MQQGPSKEIVMERIYELAEFFGKNRDDPKLNSLIKDYHLKLDQMPMPKSRTDDTINILECMKDIEKDPVIDEEKWWTKNSFYVAVASRFGFTKNEWKNLIEYIQK